MYLSVDHSYKVNVCVYGKYMYMYQYMYICIIMKTINAYLESTSLDDTHSETDLGLSNIPVSCRAALFVGYVCLVVNA